MKISTDTCWLLLPALVPASPAVAQCLESEVQAVPGESQARFGSAIGLAGDQLLVGAEAQDVGAVEGAGAVHVFERAGNAWVFVQELTASDGEAFDLFGAALSASGDRVAIGTPYRDPGGAVYLFERVNGVWSEAAIVAPAELEFGASHGLAVALDGDRLVSGAPWKAQTGDDSGAAYVHELEGGAWRLRGKLVGSDTGADDNFGFSVATHAGRIVVGATRADPLGTSTGAAYVFAPAGPNWVEDAVLAVATTDAKPGQGWSVALENDRAFVGAPHADPHCPADPECDSGLVYAWERDASGWSLVAELASAAPSPQAYFGRSLAVAGDLLVVGERGVADGVDGAGALGLFERRVDGWVSLARVVAPQPGAFDEHGKSVAADGERVAAGAIRREGGAPNSGTALVWVRPTPVGTGYCQAEDNSTGAPGTIGATGSSVVADGCLHLHAASLPADQFGYFLTSQTQAFVQNPGGSQGNLCLGGTIGRYAKDVRSTGTLGGFTLEVDLADLPPPLGFVSAGETWSFQAWFRDKNPTPTSNFTAGVAVAFQ